MTYSKLVQDYFKKWELAPIRLIAQTRTSEIIEVEASNQIYILKVLNEIGRSSERNSPFVLESWNGNGAVKLIKHSDSALLLEKLLEPNLYELSKNGEEDKASSIFIGIIKKIHSVRIDSLSGKLPKLDSIFRYFEKTPEDMESKEIFLKAHKIGEQLLKSTKREVVLHGDLHHENVLQRISGEYVCFDPKGYIGDPCYEIATILKNPWDYPDISENEQICLDRARSFSESLDLSYERIIAFSFVHMCLSVLWSKVGGVGNYQHQLKIASFLSKHVKEGYCD
ncbi:MAG: fructosamine kinase family protein [Bdellovibrionales bacterium]|nr:fructosamine kinase family protein [Bdellovibrionales bacterium]